MKQLNVTRWAPEGVYGHLARATLEEGTTPEDFLRPEFWAHVSIKMRRLQKFELVDECEAWIAEAYVAECGRNWARVVVAAAGMTILVGESHDIGEDPRAAYKVEYRAHDKFRIRRLSDNAIIDRGIDNKRAAELRLDAHLKALAA